MEQDNIPDLKSASFSLTCRFRLLEQLTAAHCIDSTTIVKKFNKQNTFKIEEYNQKDIAGRFGLIMNLVFNTLSSPSMVFSRRSFTWVILTQMVGNCASSLRKYSEGFTQEIG